jgi:hypothetical protein
LFELKAVASSFYKMFLKFKNAQMHLKTYKEDLQGSEREHRKERERERDAWRQ